MASCYNTHYLGRAESAEEGLLLTEETGKLHLESPKRLGQGSRIKASSQESRDARQEKQDELGEPER